MSNNISKLESSVFNSEGNVVLSERTDGSGKTQTIKYGLIKLMGDKEERRVSLKTLVDLTKAREANFSGQINIPELNMSVLISQIVMMRSETEEIKEQNNFINLPTKTIYLDENFYLLTDTRRKIEREHDTYYIATCHYVVKDGEEQYFLEPNQIQYLVEMVRDDEPGYPHYVKKATRYGRDVREIKKEQEEKQKKRK